MSKLILAGVVPELRLRANTVEAHASSAFIKLIWTQGHRDGAYQEKLYAQGRTTPGKIVTRARAVDSPHCYDCALDFAIMVDGKPNWDDSEPEILAKYRKVGQLAVELGMAWGGNFHHADNDHLELPNWKDYPFHG
jgi:peptidoglycan L-alanyl-D-glutamate endopeptidase CwlK